MGRMHLFEEKVYPILIRELMKHEEIIKGNDQKMISSILENVVIDGKPLSEMKRSSSEFIKNNKEKILEDIQLMKHDPEAFVHHPNSATHPSKMKIIATASLMCEEKFKKKEFFDSEFRAVFKREVNELSLKDGIRIRKPENYLIEYYDRLTKLVDEIKAEKIKEKNEPEIPESHEEKSEEPEESHPKKIEKEELFQEDKDFSDKKLQVKVKKLSSQEVKEAIIGSEDNKNKKSEKEDLIAELSQKCVGTPMDVDSSKPDDKVNESAEKNQEKLINFDYDADDFLEFKVKSLELNDWTVGKLALAPTSDFMYWPCIVTEDSETNKYIKEQRVGDKSISMIHVKYFGQVNVQNKWVDKKTLIEYNGSDDCQQVAKVFTDAIDEIQRMGNMEVQERIDDITSNKKRAFSQSAPTSQEPETKKIKLDDQTNN